MFEYQVVWITGASSGIGEALALQFAAAKARLVLSARRETELDRVWHLCAGRGLPLDQMLVLPLDVTDYLAMPGAVARVMQRFGRIDMLINNAGISQRSRCVDTDMEVYRRLMEVNVFGQIALTKQVLPRMMSSAAGTLPSPPRSPARSAQPLRPR